MSIGKGLLPEFDQEMAKTRLSIDRVPNDKLGWTPHEKSNTMGWLAAHLARLPTWVNSAIEEDSFDLNPPGGAEPPAPVPDSVEEILDGFDRNVTSARALISEASDEQLMEPWRLLSGGEELFALPRIAVIRSWVMNHMIHHRAQLGVYFRLNDIPVPAIYGPSADEQGM